MILVSDLVREHQIFEASTPLKGNIGDGYLFTKNPVFRNIRKKSNRLGVVYSDRQGIFDYRLCANIPFDKIIRQKKVPYVKNLEALQKIHSLFPRLPVRKMLEIKRNNVLHESSHIVAHSIFKCQMRRSQSSEYQNAFVFTSLLGESFATACETIGQICCDDAIHDWLYHQNTNVYGCQSAEYRALLLGISERFGVRFCAKLSILSFLFWNFFYLGLNKEDLNILIYLSGTKRKVSTRDYEKITSFCSFHFRINSWFRKEVAGFYFYSSGFKQPLSVLLRFDFISLFLRNDEWQEKLDRLVDLAFEDVTLPKG